MEATLEMARQAKRSAIARGLASRKQVNGIGIARSGDGYALKVNLLEPITDGLPEEIQGVPVRVDIVGPAFPA